MSVEFINAVLTYRLSFHMLGIILDGISGYCAKYTTLYFSSIFSHLPIAVSRYFFTFQTLFTLFLDLYFLPKQHYCNNTGYQRGEKFTYNVLMLTYQLFSFFHFFSGLSIHKHCCNQSRDTFVFWSFSLDIVSCLLILHLSSFSTPKKEKPLGFQIPYWMPRLVNLRPGHQIPRSFLQRRGSVRHLGEWISVDVFWLEGNEFPFSS